MATIAESLVTAVQQHQSGNLQQAEQIYRQILGVDPQHVEALHLLGVIALQSGKYDQAIDYIGQAVRLKPDHAEAQGNLGVAFKEQGKLEEAVAHYQQALRFKPDFAMVHYNLGVVRSEQGKLEEAVACYQQALHFKPDYAEAHNNLGNDLKALGRVDEAMASYEQALRFNPNFAEAYNNLGSVFCTQGKLENARATYLRALAIQPASAVFHSNLGLVLRELGNVEEAEAHLQESLRLKPTNGVRVGLATLLPPLYQSLSELQRWRQRLLDHVGQLRDAGITLDLSRDPGIQLFYLAYQGLNDREVQRDVARLYVAPRAIARRPSPVQVGEAFKIKVGILSTYFNSHTIGKLTRGLIAQLSRQEFSVTVLSLGSHHDETARFIQRHADRYVVIPANLPAARRAITELDLDILYYTDIGMEPLTYSLAFSRLAPVQCVTWGHPVTTGIETMDYFVSSEALETADAEQHYTETLVRLKNLPVYYYRPTLRSAPKGRAAFGLPEAEHLYACPQSLFKFHPEFDALLGQILRTDPQGTLVLIQGMHRYWETLLLRRFARTIPDVVDRVRFVPRQEYEDFLHLYTVCDVLLDPIHFGGGNSSYEALALGVPIVTLPSQFLRGRITFALYQQMRVLDCVASNPEEYVQIAVKLGTDPDYRTAIRSKILAANSVLYENSAGVRELEQFFQQALASARTRAGGIS